MPTTKPKLPMRGRWRILSMTEWDLDFVNAEAAAFIEFDAFGTGEFQFGDIRGVMDCRPATRDDVPSVEWTWEGTDEMDVVAGRGWAALNGDELHGMICFRGGDRSGFVAKRVAMAIRLKPK